jgi:biotin carboxyl carrier protein
MQFKVGDLAEILEGEVLRTTDNNSVLVKIGGKQHILRLLMVKKHSKMTEVLEKASAIGGVGGGDRNLTSQIPGRVVNIAAKPGTEVKKGDVIVVLESMKMQVAVKAHKDGNLKEIKVKQGASVARNDVLAVIE